MAGRPGDKGGFAESRPTLKELKGAFGQEKPRRSLTGSSQGKGKFLSPQKRGRPPRLLPATVGQRRERHATPGRGRSCFHLSCALGGGGHPLLPNSHGCPETALGDSRFPVAPT